MRSSPNIPVTPSSPTHRRRVPLTGLALCLGASVGIGSMEACANLGECEVEYFICPRDQTAMNECEDRWEFEGKEPIEDEDDARSACLCYTASCNDGLAAELCLPAPVGVEANGAPSFSGDAATFPDGTVLGFGPGYARCFGFSSCQYSSADCASGRWFLECTGPDQFVLYNGQVVTNRDDAVVACGGF